jgi:hypothetical protein
VRVIQSNLLDDGRLYLLIVYTKARLDNLPVDFLNQIKKEIKNG